MQENPKNIYALLIGINAYSEKSVPKVPNALRGCENDVDAIKDALNLIVGDKPGYRLHVKTLLNDQATRAEMIRTFREFLIQNVKEGDTVYFHFSGHGSFEKAPVEFEPYFSQGQLETQVYYDSREPGKYDLADKEFAVLLSEIPKGVHTFVMFDCCFSDSGARDNETYRYHDGQDRTRKLEDFLGDYHLQNDLKLPLASYIFFAASTRYQRAREITDEKGNKLGAFTHAFLRTLNNSQNSISYFELFQQLNLHMSLKKHNTKTTLPQTPRWNQYGAANIHQAFLLGKFIQNSERSLVKYEQGNWSILQGAINGLDTRKDIKITFPLFDTIDAIEPVSMGQLKQIGFQKSTLEPSVGLDTSKKYYAEITQKRMPILIDDESSVIKRYIADQASTFLIETSLPNSSRFAIKASATIVELWDMHQDQLIIAIRSWTKAILPYLRSVLKKVYTWEMLRQLSNPHASLDPHKISFGFALEEKRKPLEPWWKTPIKVSYSEVPLEYSLWGENHSDLPLYFFVLYLGPRFEIQVHYRDEDPKSSQRAILSNSMHFVLEDGIEKENNLFRLFYSTEYLGEGLTFDAWEEAELPFWGETTHESQVWDLSPDRGFELARGSHSRNLSAQTADEWDIIDLEVEVQRL